MALPSMSLEQADQVVQKLWAEDVKVWESEWAPTFRKFAGDLVRDARISPGQLVLDIGTGTGVAAFEAARRTKPDGFVFGIDRLDPMLAAAKANPETKRFKNIRFTLVDSQRLFFPDQLFNAVISNCGISPVGFRQTICEVFRVLRGGGTFVYSDWRLRDVPAHRIFGEVLQRQRTQNPSTELRLQRTALADLERFGNREMNLDEQIRQLRLMGFRKIEVRNRSYKIRFRDTHGYLDMRLKRATLKQELKELSTRSRQEFRHALEHELKQFVRGERFLFDWKVIFVRAEKA
jgi:ubiquinone/menaquinone biosynthesis C-methylase UbiE